jgi:hypothetical protein
MKTMKIFAALSLALIIGIATAYSGNNPNVSAKNAGAPVIKYVVHIHPQSDLGRGKIYLVQIVNPLGKPVAPSQTYVPGVNYYTFNEGGNVRGARIARLIYAPNQDHGDASPTLYCQPDILTGTFLGGTYYFFDLFPTTVAPTKE